MDSIIFDVDGTLWDSVDPVAESWNLAIAENTDMTPDLTRDSLAWLFGKTMTEIADALFSPDSTRRKNATPYDLL